MSENTAPLIFFDTSSINKLLKTMPQKTINDTINFLSSRKTFTSKIVYEEILYGIENQKIEIYDKKYLLNITRS